ncbi:MAG TPA: LCP family protein [Fimbriimonadaceae bacterium]|nr:LCP family protein [Fimbriimonadaceae bacterium]
MKWVKWILYGLFCLTCLAVGAGYRLFSNVVASLGGGEKGALEVIQTLRDPRGEFPGKDQLTILVVGQDYNRDRKGMPYTKNSRADTIILLSADLENKKVRACSIPRDTYVTAADQVTGKINGTLARGGIDTLRDTLEQMFGIQIDSYVLVKPYAVRKIVDAVGGVEVVAMDDMKYDDSWGQLHVDIAQGQHHLNGVQAEGFVRFRKMNPGEGRSNEEGDIRRTARQQQLIQAMMVAANGTGNIFRADEIIDTGFEQIDTNLTRLQCVALAQIFKGASMGSMVSATVPGEDKMMGDAYYYMLDYDRAQSTVDWLIKGDELAMRKLVRVQIRNGTKTPGMARLAADLLGSQGYTASAPGNAPQTKLTTIVYRKSSFESAAREIQRALGAASITKDAKPANDWEPEIQVVIGDDAVKKLQTTTGTT